jgi:hypothetical protein
MPVDQPGGSEGGFIAMRMAGYKARIGKKSGQAGLAGHSVGQSPARISVVPWARYQRDWSALISAVS